MCVHIYVFIYIHVHMYICVHVYMYTHIYTYIYTYLYKHMYLCMYVYVYQVLLGLLFCIDAIQTHFTHCLIHASYTSVSRADESCPVYISPVMLVRRPPYVNESCHVCTYTESCRLWIRRITHKYMNTHMYLHVCYICMYVCLSLWVSVSLCVCVCVWL